MAKEGSEKEKKPVKMSSAYMAILVMIALAVLVVVAIVFIVPNYLTGVSFSTFKTNFNDAQRIAFVVTAFNQSTYANESTCSTSAIQIISRLRNPATIDFFIITNNTCTYSPNGLGKPTTPLTTTAASCLKTANSESGVFLNYSSFNNTVITPYHLYVYGNSQYMRRCPIAADFS